MVSTQIMHIIQINILSSYTINIICSQLPYALKLVYVIKSYSCIWNNLISNIRLIIEYNHEWNETTYNCNFRSFIQFATVYDKRLLFVHNSIMLQLYTINDLFLYTILLSSNTKKKNNFVYVCANIIFHVSSVYSTFVIPCQRTA